MKEVGLTSLQSDSYWKTARDQFDKVGINQSRGGTKE